MWPYFVLLFLPAILPLVIFQPRRLNLEYNYQSIVRKRNKMMIFLFFFLLFILMVLRDVTVGKDLLTYKTIFEICKNTSFDNLHKINWEYGYLLYNKIIAIILDNYQFFLMVSAAIILWPIYKLYSQEKKYGFLLIVLFVNMPCFLMMFSGLRQAIAVSLGVFVYMAIEKRKIVHAVLILLLAISFHSSAFVLILLFPANMFTVKVKHLWLIVPMMLIVFVFRVPLFTFVLRYLPTKYIDFYGELQQTGAIGMLLLFLIFSIFSFVVLDETRMTEKDHFMRNMLLLSTVFQFFVPVHSWVQRASYYFLIFAPTSLVSVVKAPRKRWKNISNTAVVVMSLFFAFYFFYTALFSTDNLLDVFPYKFFWG